MGLARAVIIKQIERYLFEWREKLYKNVFLSTTCLPLIIRFLLQPVNWNDMFFAVIISMIMGDVLDGFYFR